MASESARAASAGSPTGAWPASGARVDSHASARSSSAGTLMSAEPTMTAFLGRMSRRPSRMRPSTA
ncbi:hypothetical protein E1286_30425 [Nonomuraea terrae]|uniref:Uncharacterized protein n=1 Tax=Nonomuraea terrae TaxID=2530383 RepID=A0A4R4YD61_9ACTN|nr:hypothetical protein [Nonomuraea terrae]TDD42611.1 hypothetical protein E1286_30425 [Nonomuraea terrae]